MIDAATLDLNSECYCWPVERAGILEKISAQGASPDMEAMLSVRPHYFASTTIMLASDVLAQMTQQIRAIEDVIKLPLYREAVQQRSPLSTLTPNSAQTAGVFMGYDFHITEDGPRLIEINSNAGGAFIVDMIEQTVKGSSDNFSRGIVEMFHSEWAKAGRITELKTIAIIDTDPTEQYHFPDMCLAKAILEKSGLNVVIADPSALRHMDGHLYHEADKIDLIYNRLTDFNLSEPANDVIKHAYEEDAAVVTPAPHHHALYADKRNLILLSDSAQLTEFGASEHDMETLQLIPQTKAVTPDTAEDMWANRRKLFFKPEAGFGSRGAFRGAKLTKKVWGEILDGGYIAQALVSPPIRAVTVDDEKLTLKFDVRVYTYDGAPLLYAARIYQGQTTNLRTAGGGLAAVIPLETPFGCGPKSSC